MRRKIRYYRLIWFKHDLPAGLSVFLVALPLCMGIALASGAPLYAGIVSGIIGGIVVSFISGSALAVSGPAAGLTTIVAASIVSLGDYKVFLLAVIVVGIFQLLLGILRLGTIANYFPSAVIKGMLAAIGILLISKEIPFALGYDQPDIVINLIFTKTSAFSLKPTQLVTIPSNIFASISFPDFSKFFSNTEIWKDGLIIGLLATLETLLCVEAIDKLDIHNRITPVNRELVAQGIGNICCGIFGAIPMTAVIIRGAANVDAGGRTKLSAFTHGLFLLVAVLVIPSVLSMIPFASLAAILLITGYNLTKPKLYRNMWSLGWKQFLPFMITIIVILATDLLIGVSIGLLLSIYFIVQNNFKAEYKINKTVREGIEYYYINLNSNVTFLNKVKLRDALEDIPDESELTIDGSHCNFIDYDILEIVSEYEHKADDRNIKVILKGIERVNVTAIH